MQQQVKPTAQVYEHLGRNLRRLRTENGLTQADVARIINVSPQQYQKYEDAQSKCSLTYVIDLANHYGVHVNSILPVDAPSQDTPPIEAQLPKEADLLARLVSSFVQISDGEERLRLVQLVEAMVSAHKKSEP